MIKTCGLEGRSMARGMANWAFANAFYARKPAVGFAAHKRAQIASPWDGPSLGRGAARRYSGPRAICHLVTTPAEVS